MRQLLYESILFHLERSLQNVLKQRTLLHTPKLKDICSQSKNSLNGPNWPRAQDHIEWARAQMKVPSRSWGVEVTDSICLRWIGPNRRRLAQISFCTCARHIIDFRKTLMFNLFTLWFPGAFIEIWGCLRSHNFLFDLAPFSHRSNCASESHCSESQGSADTQSMSSDSLRSIHRL